MTYSLCDAKHCYRLAIPKSLEVVNTRNYGESPDRTGAGYKDVQHHYCPLYYR
ncbi:hypothetical protein BABINDRAFT_161182 [Babjeviella inositovora NRRL Y-12698]|uniref:Uncharacterized protein n=1 Tax=Babjeviella inositovora NRRL Y-12698 TaxID=984486 RepID=A0A1E3QT72_9ASCO|nr:uncharacterized protein BABINDRAFT_161182 [Babjeviella inositovora NRRL Y-12698]ODQ80212.1 hypothetical protein BABINDRAFT_161182 [Babjeviella inositovora NRRL Y-12698]